MDARPYSRGKQVTIFALAGPPIGLLVQATLGIPLNGPLSLIGTFALLPYSLTMAYFIGLIPALAGAVGSIVGRGVAPGAQREHRILRFAAPAAASMLPVLMLLPWTPAPVVLVLALTAAISALCCAAIVETRAKRAPTHAMRMLEVTITAGADNPKRREGESARAVVLVDERDPREAEQRALALLSAQAWSSVAFERDRVVPDGTDVSDWHPALRTAYAEAKADGVAMRIRAAAPPVHNQPENTTEAMP